MSVLQYLVRPVMKKPYLLLICLITLSLSATAQDVIRVQSCANDMISKQADSLKALYGNDGYILLKHFLMNLLCCLVS